jgi:hypothetical protein
VCPRPAEVRVNYVDNTTGATRQRENLCPLHCDEAVSLAFVDVDRDTPPVTVSARSSARSPLGELLPCVVMG